MPAVPQPDPGIFRRPVDGREGLPGGLVPGTNSKEERAAASGCFPRGLGNANRLATWALWLWPPWSLSPLQLAGEAGDPGGSVVQTLRGPVASGPFQPFAMHPWCPRAVKPGIVGCGSQTGLESAAVYAGEAGNPPALGRGPWRLPGDPRRPRRCRRTPACPASVMSRGWPRSPHGDPTRRGSWRGPRRGVQG